MSYLSKKFQENVKELAERTGKKSIYQQRLEYQKILSRIPHDEEGNVVYKDPDLFYHTFGHVYDSYTRAEITKLSSYQRLFWHSALNFDNLITVKTNKAGIEVVKTMGSRIWKAKQGSLGPLLQSYLFDPIFLTHFLLN